MDLVFQILIILVQQVFLRIIPKAPGSLFAFFKYFIPKASAAYSLALLNAKNFLLDISGPIANITFAISMDPH